MHHLGRRHGRRHRLPAGTRQVEAPEHDPVGPTHIVHIQGHGCAWRPARRCGPGPVWAPAGDEAGGIDGRGRPALATLDAELAQQGDGTGVVVVTGTPDQAAVLEHLDEDLTAQLGAYDREGPVGEGADAAGGYVGVLGGEVGAGLAALPGPGMALLEGYLVVVAVAHPDLEHALDVHLDHVLLAQPVLGFEQLGEDGVVEGLGAQQAHVQHEAPGWLAGFAHRHHRGHRAVAAHAHQGQLLGPAGHRLVVGHGGDRVGVAAAGGGQHLLPGGGDARHCLPRRAVTLEVGHEGSVDVAVLQAPHEQGRDQSTVLAQLVDVVVARPGQDDVLGDAVDLLGSAGAAEEVGVDLGLPGAEAGAGAGAGRAPPITMAAAPGPPSSSRWKGL